MKTYRKFSNQIQGANINSWGYFQSFNVFEERDQIFDGNSGSFFLELGLLIVIVDDELDHMTWDRGE